MKIWNILLILLSIPLPLAHTCEPGKTAVLKQDQVIDGVPVKAGTYYIRDYEEKSKVAGQPSRKVSKFVSVTLSASYSAYSITFPTGSNLTLDYAQFWDEKSRSYGYLPEVTTAEPSQLVEAWGIPVVTPGRIQFYKHYNGQESDAIYGYLPPDKGVKILGYPLKAGTDYQMTMACEFAKCPQDERAIQRVVRGTLAEGTQVKGVDLPADTLLSFEETHVYHLFGSLDGKFWKARLSGPATVLGYALGGSEVTFYSETGQPEAFKLAYPTEVQGIPLGDDSKSFKGQKFTVYFHPSGELEAGRLSRPFDFKVRGQTISAAGYTPVWFFAGKKVRQLTLAGDTLIQGHTCLKARPIQFDESGALLYCDTAANDNFGQFWSRYWYDIDP